MLGIRWAVGFKTLLDPFVLLKIILFKTYHMYLTEKFFRIVRIVIYMPDTLKMTLMSSVIIKTVTTIYWAITALQWTTLYISYLIISAFHEVGV
jgi:hypothetical protein